MTIAKILFSLLLINSVFASNDITPPIGVKADFACTKKIITDPLEQFPDIHTLLIFSPHNEIYYTENGQSVMKLQYDGNDSFDPTHGNRIYKGQGENGLQCIVKLPSIMDYDGFEATMNCGDGVSWQKTETHFLCEYVGGGPVISPQNVIEHIAEEKELELGNQSKIVTGKIALDFKTTLGDPMNGLPYTFYRSVVIRTKSKKITLIERVDTELVNKGGPFTFLTNEGKIDLYLNDMVRMEITTKLSGFGLYVNTILSAEVLTDLRPTEN